MIVFGNTLFIAFPSVIQGLLFILQFLFGRISENMFYDKPNDFGLVCSGLNLNR